MMNNFKLSQNQRHSSSKNNKKKRLTQEQVRLLEASFNAKNRLDPERKLQLAHELDIPPRQIAIWYQNKRARWKNQSLEMDYSALHMRLEAALAQKRQLEKEVQRIRVELQKSQAEIANFKQLQVQYSQVQQALGSHVSNSLSSNCDEAGSSSLNGQHQIIGSNWMNDHDQALRVEDLYACLMGAN